MSFPFEAKVGEFVAAGKTPGEAVRLVARQFPDLHQDFIARSQPGGKAIRGLSVIERMRHLAR